MKSNSTFLDTAGKPINGTKGYARVRKTYDANRHEIEDRYFDALGNAVMTGNGFAILRTRYDRRGNKVEFATYDLNDRPKLRAATLGFAVTRDVFDGRGLLVADRLLRRRRQAGRGRRMAGLSRKSPTTIPVT